MAVLIIEHNQVEHCLSVQMLKKTGICLSIALASTILLQNAASAIEPAHES